MYSLAIFTTILGFAVLSLLKTPRRRQRLGEPSIVPEDVSAEEE